MTDIRTISGIPNKTWNEAKTEYDNVSNKIKELLEQDLRSEEDEDTGKVDLLKNSSLQRKQIKVARKILTEGQVDKNEQQLGQIISTLYSDDDYRTKCKQALINCDNFPYEKHKGGIRNQEMRCPECDAGIYVSGLRENNFRCVKCDARLFDV
jgi:tRNA(Ile2) C34 agmatinyltransferase TiaS